VDAGFVRRSFGTSLREAHATGTESASSHCHWAIVLGCQNEGRRGPRFGVGLGSLSSKKQCASESRPIRTLSRCAL